jgi:hypothetical protein
MIEAREAYLGVRLKADSLLPQEPLFFAIAFFALIAPERTIAADDAVTGDLRRVGISFQGLTHRARGTASNLFGELGIGGHPAGGNSAEGSIDALFKFGGLAQTLHGNSELRS